MSDERVSDLNYELSLESDRMLSFCQALAWIAWGTDEAVSRCDPIALGAFFAADILGGLAAPIAVLGKPALPIYEAKDYLLGLLTAGAVRAMPRPNSFLSPPHEILDSHGFLDPTFWIELCEVQSWHGDDLLISGPTTDQHARGDYAVHGVLIFEKVLKQFHPPGAGKSALAMFAALPRKRPASPTPKLTRTERLIADAIRSLWPDEIPQFVTLKERDNQIFQSMNGVRRMPHAVTFRRYFKKIGHQD